VESRIVNICRRRTVNIGDLCCAPMLYYQIPGFGSSISEIYDLSEGSERDVLIVGGGGVFNPSGILSVEAALRFPFRTKIIWGCGLNGADEQRSRDAIRSFDLAGMRESCGADAELAPCTSCKSPEFDGTPPAPTTDIVVYDHHAMRVPVDGFPRLSNAAPSMREAVKFLASGATVLTNSYHGVYWSMLLGRKVLVFVHNDFPHPTSKLHTIPFRPILTTRDSWKSDLRRAFKVDGFLGWCRYHSDRFFVKVCDLCPK
jgi:hypothetical protein